MCKTTISLLAGNKEDCCQTADTAEARRKLRKVFKDMCRRSSHPNLGLDLQTFLKCTGLCGLLGEQFFKALDDDDDDFLSSYEFEEGFVKLYSGSVEQRTGTVFDVLDFGRKGIITKKGVKIIQRYLPKVCQKCGTKLTRTWNFLTELSTLFSDSEVLSYDEVQEAVTRSPYFFESVLQALLTTLPPVFQESFETACTSCIKGEEQRLIPLKFAERRYFAEVRDQAIYLYSSVDRRCVKRIIVLRGLFVEPQEDLKLALKSGEFQYVLEAMTVADRDAAVETILSATHYRWFDDFYEIGEIIGEGASGQVVKAVHRVTGTVAAVKIINKDNVTIVNEARIRREIDILRLARHENLLELYDVFETNERVYIVTELVSGGTLFDWLKTEGFKVPEEVAKGIVRDLAAGLHFLHKLGVVHRDVKLENVLLVQSGNSFRAKLIDYGLATFLGPGDTSQEPVGTLKYVSPEVLSRLHYREKADNWSLGVILYIMLHGTLPFYGKTEEETALRILKRRIRLDTQGWAGATECAKKVIEGLLCRVPDARMSLKNLLGNSWLAEHSPAVETPCSLLF